MLRTRAVAGLLAASLILAGCSAGATASNSSGTGSSPAATAAATSSGASTSAATSSAGSTAATSSATSAAVVTTSAASATSASLASATASAQTSTQQSSVSTPVQTVAGVPTPELVAASAGAPAGQSPPLAPDSVINVAKKDTPGVVQITNEQVQLGSLGNSQTVPTGVGTGIVLDNQGHILTNDHVVRGAQKLIVTLADGTKEYPAKLVGADPRTDLAVIQVSGAQLTALALGDSGKLAVGQWVVAIGNALALPGGPTVTAGVVSALGRTVQEPPIQSSNGQGTSGQGRAAQTTQPTTAGPYLFDVIQTSAPINPGNSGGPLVNLDGQVVGINTLEAGQSEPGGPQAEGIGFAIAINTAKKIADTLMTQGHIDYAYLGVDITDNSPALAQRYGVPNVPGVVVLQLPSNSPAGAAGIQAKDVITAIDGHAIADTSSLALTLQSYKPGDKITLTWVQASDGQKVSKPVTLGQAPPL
jgi:serine protease Do